MKTPKSRKLWQIAKEYIPGGVNSPVRAFKGVGGDPVFIKMGRGSHIYDVDGNRYIDYVLSWGPLILGHAHPAILKAIKDASRLGTSFGAPTEGEVELAKMITGIYPSMEKVRLVNSGTEAAMSAIRLARGFANRNKIIKFEGCYHGHVDSLLVQAGSGATTLGVPDSSGIPIDSVKDTITLPFNDLDKVNAACKAHGRDIACLIVEPVAGNMGVIPPKQGFLEGLREITARYNIVLIFDEVMTGFRVALGGAQELYGIKPDMTTLGKIVGGGLPVGAFGGRRDIMEKLAPTGPVYQAGTLSGNPLAVACGIATLKILSKGNVHKRLEKMSRDLSRGLKEAADKSGVKVFQTRVGSMLCLFFTEEKVVDYKTALSSDRTKYAVYFHNMLKRGVYLAPSQFEAAFLSTAHSEDDIDKTIRAAQEAMRKVKA
jgi:glutamate-1-semialdehyde 2,1-aminomutase